MQAATARSARETIFGEQGVGQLQEDVNLNAIRYFVQMGWGQLDVDTLAIPNRVLLRGEITPCRTYPQKANILEIREADLIPGSEQADKDGRTVYGFYRRHGYYEAERLVELETRAERQTGLFEVTALKGELGNEVYRKVNFNTLFFPSWPALPEKNEDVIKGLEARLAELRSSTPSGIPAHYLPVIFATGEQLIEAAYKAEKVQKHLLTRTHSGLRMAPKDDGYKREYDDVDYEMLVRTGTPQIHSEAVQTARALEKLTENSAGGSSDTREVIGLLQQQIAQQNEIIQMLMAERNGQKLSGQQQNQKK